MKNFKVNAHVMKDGCHPIQFSNTFKARNAEEAEDLAESKFDMIRDDLAKEFDGDDDELIFLQILEVIEEND